MKKLTAVFFLCIFVLAGCGSTGSDSKSLSDQKEITIAIAPTNDPQQAQAAAESWSNELTPIFQDMGYDNLTVNVTVATDPTAITEGVASGKIDVGFVPASNYVISKDAHPDDINVLMQGTRQDRNPDGSYNETVQASNYDSALYVNKEVYDSQGMSTWTNQQHAEWLASGEPTVSVSSYTSPAAYVWPINFFLDNGQDPNGVNWVKTDNNYSAVEQVADGNADATFTYLGATNDVIDSGNEDYQDINSKEVVAIQNVGQVRIPNDVAIVSSAYDEESQTAIYTAFETMAGTESGNAALYDAYGWTGVTRVADDSSDWATVSEYITNYEPYKK